MTEKGSAFVFINRGMHSFSRRCVVTQVSRVYPSYFKLQVRWLRSLTPVTYSSKLLGIHSLAAFLQLELFRVYDQKVDDFNQIESF